MLMMVLIIILGMIKVDFTNFLSYNNLKLAKRVDMTYILVDTANMFFRARHVVRGDSIETKIGMAYHIMFSSILKAYKDFNGSHVVFCLEGRSWRKDVYEPYKKNRQAARDALTPKEQEEDQAFWKAFDELKDIGIKGVVQGDIMFTKKDLKVTNINGVKHVTFQPNTIVYAVPVNSELGKKIGKSKLGVIFHTTYSGNDFESMKASYKVDVGSFKKSPSIFFDDAGLKDVSGTLLSKEETDEVTTALSKAGKIFQKIALVKLSKFN